MTPFHIDIDAQTFFFVAGLSYVIGLFLAGTLAVAVNRPFFGWVAKAFVLSPIVVLIMLLVIAWDER